MAFHSPLLAAPIKYKCLGILEALHLVKDSMGRSPEFWPIGVCAPPGWWQPFHPGTLNTWSFYICGADSVIFCELYSNLQSK